MPFHFWLSKISSGAIYMDALHHDTVQALMRISTTADQEFCEGYGLLLHKVERIFRTEERWMEEIDSPELKHHRAQHARILGNLYQGQSHIARGDTQFGRNIIDKSLPEWLFFHASTMDSTLAQELRMATLAG